MGGVYMFDIIVNGCCYVLFVFGMGVGIRVFIGNGLVVFILNV